MKKLLFVLLFFICISSFSQVYTIPDQEGGSTYHISLPAGTYRVSASSPAGRYLFGIQDESDVWHGAIMPDPGDDDGYLWSEQFTTYRTYVLPQDIYIFYDVYNGSGSLTLTFFNVNTPSLDIDLGNDINVPAGTDLTVGAEATGGLGPYTYSWTVGRQPTNYPNDHTVFYSNPTAGEFDLTLTVTDSLGSTASDSVHVTLTVVDAPVWKPNPVYTVPDNGHILCSLIGFIESGTQPITFSIENGYSLPSGISLSNGTVYGDFSIATQFTCRFVASNTAGSAAKDVTFNFNGEAPQFTGSLPWSEILIKGGSGIINLSNYHTGSNITYTVTGLPSWASFSGDTITFNVPADLSSTNFTGIEVTASNSFGECINTLGLTIKTIGSTFYFLSPTTLNAPKGQNMQYQVSTNLPANYSLGAAPSFLSMDSNGNVTGVIPEGINQFEFEVIASNVEQGTISQTVTVVVTDADGNSEDSNHVIVDNFEDFGSTLFAQDVRTYLNGLYANTKSLNEQFGQFTGNLNGKLDTINQNISGINNGVNNINNSIGGIKSSLDDIKNKLNEPATSGASVTSPGLPDVTTLGRDWSTEIQGSSSVDISSYDVQEKVLGIFPSSNKTPPPLTIPLSCLNNIPSVTEVQDLTVDFENESFDSWRSILRIIMVTFVYLIIIYRSIAIISSLEV